MDWQSASSAEFVPEEVYFGSVKCECRSIELAANGICFYLRIPHFYFVELEYQENHIDLIEWIAYTDNSRNLKGFYAFIHPSSERVRHLISNLVSTNGLRPDEKTSSIITIRLQIGSQHKFLTSIGNLISVRRADTTNCILDYLEKSGFSVPQKLPVNEFRLPLDPILSGLEARCGNDDDAASTSTMKTERFGGLLHQSEVDPVLFVPLQASSPKESKQEEVDDPQPMDGFARVDIYSAPPTPDTSVVTIPDDDNDSEDTEIDEEQAEVEQEEEEQEEEGVIAEIVVVEEDVQENEDQETEDDSDEDEDQYESDFVVEDSDVSEDDWW